MSDLWLFPTKSKLWATKATLWTRLRSNSGTFKTESDLLPFLRLEDRYTSQNYTGKFLNNIKLKW